MSAAAPRVRDSILHDRSDVRVASLFAEAADRAGVIDRHYIIAGLGVKLRFAGEEMLARLSSAFEHLASPQSAEPSLTINIWDSTSTLGAEPPVLGKPVEGHESGPIYYYEQHGVQAISRWRTLSVLDAEAAEAWFWTPAFAEMASWDWAAPLRAILHWWLGRHGILQVHGGAIGMADGGVLVVGRGGSGKSTTTLAALAAGLRYAGDDFVAIATGADPWVHSLYCSGKLESHHLQRFPRLLTAVANPDHLPEEKVIVFVERAFPGSATAGFPLRAVLVPRIVADRPETRIVPVPAPVALAALAPSTIFQLHPPQPNALTEMAALVRIVPCLSLELGSDINRIPDAIVDFLEAGP